MTAPLIGMVWAQADGGVIGRDGAMPWHIPEDLAHFKRITTGSPVIMGRKTWDSLPPRFRPLPGRRNIVVTRQADWSAAGVDAAASVARALELAAASGSPTTWIIGGAAIYAQLLDRAARLEITEVNARFEGDTVAPSIDAERWTVTAADPREGWHTSDSGLEYRFVTYESTARARSDARGELTRDTL